MKTAEYWREQWWEESGKVIDEEDGAVAFVKLVEQIQQDAFAAGGAEARKTNCVDAYNQGVKTGEANVTNKVKQAIAEAHHNGFVMGETSGIAKGRVEGMTEAIRLCETNAFRCTTHNDACRECAGLIRTARDAKKE